MKDHEKTFIECKKCYKNFKTITKIKKQQKKNNNYTKKISSGNH